VLIEFDKPQSPAERSGTVLVVPLTLLNQAIAFFANGLEAGTNAKLYFCKVLAVRMRTPLSCGICRAVAHFRLSRDGACRSVAILHGN
jgi:hypothetical protein